MNQEHPDVQAGFQRGGEPEIKLPTFTAAAAAAKSLQSCPTLYNPIDGSLPGSLVPGILQARTLEWVAILLLRHKKDQNIAICSNMRSPSPVCHPAPECFF